jgi:hypothetical protein
MRKSYDLPVEEFWINFVHPESKSPLCNGIPLYSAMGRDMSPRRMHFYEGAIAAFKEDIEKLGGLSSIKPGEFMTIGKVGSLDVVIYRISTEL